jgi:murein DD-endopeptidase MepM/ murein hydrolase activator NlpD
VAILLTAEPSVFYPGRGIVIRYRVDDNAKRVQVRLYMRRLDGPRRRVAVKLGRRTTNKPHSYYWRNSQDFAGRTEIRIWARDPAGNRIAHSAEKPGSVVVRALSRAFPIVGAFSFGGEDARFGAARRGHTHQGQDVIAAEGTPLVAVAPGRITWSRFQAGGAGYYLVLAADGENRSYVYMHLQEGSLTVREGDRVVTGQKLGNVGNTGNSHGAHLHFEEWVGAWYDGGHPIDPLPDLKAWMQAAGLHEANRVFGDGQPEAQTASLHGPLD